MHRKSAQVAGWTTRAWIVCLVPAIAACVAFAPALWSDFVSDDWAILALARHGGPWWSYFFTDHAATYSYRPNGMLVWRLIADVFADQPMPQYVVQIGLHAANASMLAILLLRLDAGPSRALLFGLVFALHPIAFGTGLWLSDRYDLIAANGALALLLSVNAWMRGWRGSLLLIALSACWAAGAKETALAVAPAAALWIWQGKKGRSFSRLLPAWLACLSPFVLALAARWWIFGTSGVDRVGTDLTTLESILYGVLYWLQTLPMALLGFNHGQWINLLVGLIVASLLGLAVANAWRRDIDSKPSLAVVAGAVLMLAPAVLQAPVTSFMLASPEPLSLPSNLRFYYLALAGLLICLAPLRPTRRPTQRLVATAANAMLLLAIVISGFSGWRAASIWQRDSSKPVKADMIAALGNALAEIPYREGCVIYVENMPLSAGDVRLFIDVVAKSSLRPGHPSVSCVVLSQLHSTLALTGPIHSPAGLPPGVPSRQRHGEAIASRSVMGGRLQIHFPGILSPEEASSLGNARILHWNGRDLVPVAHAD